MKRRDFFKGLAAVAAALGLPGVAKAFDHGDLDGLADDDHVQYFEEYGWKFLSRQGIENAKFLMNQLDDAFRKGGDQTKPRMFSTRSPLEYRRDEVENLFTSEQKVRAFANIITRLNEIPPFTNYTFEDMHFVMRWAEELVPATALVLLLWKRDFHSVKEIDTAADQCYRHPSVSKIFDKWHDRVWKVKGYEAGIVKILQESAKRLRNGRKI